MSLHGPGRMDQSGVLQTGERMNQTITKVLRTSLNLTRMMLVLGMIMMEVISMSLFVNVDPKFCCSAELNVSLSICQPKDRFGIKYKPYHITVKYIVFS